MVAHLCLEGIVIVPYLNDWFLKVESEALLQTHMNSVIVFLSLLGWILNSEKSNLNPTRSQFLGFIVGSKKMTLGLTPRRVASLTSQVWCVSARFHVGSHRCSPVS